jgi:hypothetical protein
MHVEFDRPVMLLWTMFPFDVKALTLVDPSPTEMKAVFAILLGNLAA